MRQNSTICLFQLAELHFSRRSYLQKSSFPESIVSRRTYADAIVFNCFDLGANIAVFQTLDFETKCVFYKKLKINTALKVS